MLRGARGGAREPGGPSPAQGRGPRAARTPRPPSLGERPTGYLAVVRPLPSPSPLGKLKLLFQGPTQKTFLLETLPRSPGTANPASSLQTRSIAGSRENCPRWRLQHPARPRETPKARPGLVSRHLAPGSEPCFFFFFHNKAACILHTFDVNMGSLRCFWRIWEGHFLTYLVGWFQERST